MRDVFFWPCLLLKIVVVADEDGKERELGDFKQFGRICAGVVEIEKYVFLVGDAAGVCKNTTGGGIITGLWSAKILADSIINGKNYSRMLSPLRHELWLHKLLRNMLDRFSDKDYNNLVRWMNSPRVKKVLKAYPREFPSRFLWRLVLANPRLLSFGRYALV